MVENTHEPLIDRETWDRVQQRLGEKRIARTTSAGTIGLFAGLIRCGDCSAALSYMRRVYEQKEAGVYRCSKYNNNGSKSCTAHYIHENVLMEFVLNDIRTHAQLAAGDQEELAARLLRSATQSRAGASQEIQQKLQAAQARLGTINAMVKNVYEDKVVGKLPEEVFQNLLVEYGREREALEAKRPEMYKQLDKAEDSERQVYEWIKRISKHVGIDELDRETIGELIDSIIVTEGDRHAIAYDCRNHRMNEISGTLQAKPNGGVSLNFLNPVCYDARGNGRGASATTLTEDHCRKISDYSPVMVMAHGQANAEITGDLSPTLNCNHEQPIASLPHDGHERRFVIRRLTPLECCRLQGFPDWWEDAVKGADTARYKMWGNGMAFPCVLYIMQGFAWALSNGEG